HEFQITQRERMSIRIGITIKRAMIGMQGVLTAVMVEVEDTMVDLEDKDVVVEEVSSLTEHVIHADLLTTT
ncbi:hypothetical protein KI387_000140, partial [Taxus chinensis]